MRIARLPVLAFRWPARGVLPWRTPPLVLHHRTSRSRWSFSCPLAARQGACHCSSVEQARVGQPEQGTPTARAVRRIRDARKARGWSVQQLADACAAAGMESLTRSTLAKIESGIREFITVDELVVIADALGLAAVDLFILTRLLALIQAVRRSQMPDSAGIGVTAWGPLYAHAASPGSMFETRCSAAAAGAVGRGVSHANLR